MSDGAFLTSVAEPDAGPSSSNSTAQRGPSLKQRLEEKAAVMAAMQALMSRAANFDYFHSRANFFERWGEHVELERQARRTLERSVQRMRHYQQHHYFERWGEHVEMERQARRTLERSVQRMRHHELADLWQRWFHLTERCHEATQMEQAAFSFFADERLRWAWLLLRRAAVARRRFFTALRQASLHASSVGWMRRLRLALVGWESFAALRTRHAAIIRHALLRLMHRRLAFGWSGWRARVAARATARAALDRLMLRGARRADSAHLRKSFDRVVDYCIARLTRDTERRVAAAAAAAKEEAKTAANLARKRLAEGAPAAASGEPAEAFHEHAGGRTVAVDHGSDLQGTPRLAPARVVLASVEKRLSEAMATIATLEATLGAERRDVKATISKLVSGPALRSP